MPSLLSREALLVGVQGALLVSRTLLTDHISRIEGRCGRAITSLVRLPAPACFVCPSQRLLSSPALRRRPSDTTAAQKPQTPPSQRFAEFGSAVLAFAAVGVPAAAVNAGLKWLQKGIELAFQQRLGLALHAAYARNRAYYAASALGGLTGADQRITEDVERFAASLSEVCVRRRRWRLCALGRAGNSSCAKPSRPVAVAVAALLALSAPPTTATAHPAHLPFCTPLPSS